MVTSAWTIAANGDWGSVGNWSGGVPDSVATDVTIFVPGTFTVTIGAAESFAIDTIDAPYGYTTSGVAFLATLDVAGALTIAENAGSSEIGNLTIAVGGLLELATTSGSGTGTLDSQATLENDGTLIASGPLPTQFQLGSQIAITNNGTFETAGGSSLAIEPQGTLTNLSASGTLTGGTYIASGNGGAIFLIPLGGRTPVVTDAATVVLDGLGTGFYGYNTAQVDIQTSLTSIAAGGVLSVLGGRGYAGTAALTDAGLLDFQGGMLTVASLTLAAGGALDFQDGTLAAASLMLAAGGTLTGFGTIEPAVQDLGGAIIAAGGTLDVSAPSAATMTAEAGGVLALNGAYAGTLVDGGGIAVMQGGLTLDGPIVGSGSLFVQGQTQNDAAVSFDTLIVAATAPTLDLETAFGGAIRFNGATSLLRLGQPATFTGSLVGFGARDTLDIAGITNATAQLTPDGTITLLSVNGSGGGKTITLDGTGYVGATAANDAAGTGSNVTVSGPVPQDYVFEGFHWASKVITWAFAGYNYSQDSTYPFSNFITAAQPLEQQAVSNAFSAWAAVSNLTFDLVSDTANPAAAADIRVGWADLGSSGELGLATTKPLGGIAQTDQLVRLQDPAQPAFQLSGTAPSNLVYANTLSHFQAVAEHEIGHTLGLFHSTDTLAVMYPISGPTNTTIGASDIAAIHALYGAPACFTSDTHLLTASGPRAVTALAAGDVAVAASGRLARVRWIGRRHLVTARHPRPWDVMPVRVTAGAFGDGVPRRDLVLSPDHAVFVAGRLVPVRYLLNGVTIRQEGRAEITYWHVELDRHDLVLAEGLACESYLDTGNRSAFEGEAALALHPDFARAVWHEAGCAELTEPGDALTAARAALLARAEAMGFRRTAEAEPVLLAGECAIRPRRQGSLLIFDLPAGVAEARLSSRTHIPAETRAESSDSRRLGMAVAGVRLDGARLRLACLDRGWHVPEAAWCWTDGDAVLPVAGARRITLRLGPPGLYWLPPCSAGAGDGYASPSRR